MRSMSSYMFKLVNETIVEECCRDHYCVFHRSARVCSFLWSHYSAIWLKNFISELNIIDSISYPVQIIVLLSKNNKRSNSSKHIEFKYLLVRDKIKKKPYIYWTYRYTCYDCWSVKQDFDNQIVYSHVISMAMQSSFDVLG